MNMYRNADALFVKYFFHSFSHAYILLNDSIFIHMINVLFNCVVIIMLHTFYVISSQRIQDVVFVFFVSTRR